MNIGSTKRLIKMGIALPGLAALTIGVPGFFVAQTLVAHAATTVVVTSASLDNTSSNPAVVATDGLNKWFMYNDTNDTIDNTLGSFVTGPATPFYGTGSIQFTLGATPLDRKNIATYQFSGTPLTSITQMSFGVYSHSGVAGPNEDPYLNFNVDFTGSTSTFQHRLVYVPSVNASVTQDAWQQWNAIASGTAKWSFSGSVWPTTLVGPDANVTSTPGTTAKNWSTILADYPNARLLPIGGWLGIRVGEPGPTNYTADVDFFSIATSGPATVFDFDPIPPPVVTITTASLPDGTVGVAYSQFVLATSSNPSDVLLWNITGLPSGLGYSTSTGKITGTPAATSTNVLDVTVTGANPSSTPATKNIGLTVDAPAPATFIVTIDKFIDGKMANATSANGAAFPMVETWTASNFSGSNVAYTLSPTGLNSPTPYEAKTSPAFVSPATYTTNEVTSGAVVGANCGAGHPFVLVGYSTATSSAAAASSTVTTSTPNFAALASNEYVIVWNKDCLPAPTLLAPPNGTVTSTAGLTSVSWNSVTDPAGDITYVYQASNSSTTNPDGSFTSPVYTSSPLTATMIPTPGTPPGIYFWHVQAKDADGNMSPWSTAWTFTVSNTIIVPTSTPRSEKLSLLTALTAYQVTISNKHDSNLLNEVNICLQNSLNPKWWIDDSHVVHTSRKGGEVFFNEECSALYLRRLINNHHDTVNTSTLQEFANGLVADDRLLATTAINEAIAAGGKSSLIANANSEITKGDTFATNGNDVKAIDNYEPAWEWALRSLNELNH